MRGTARQTVREMKRIWVTLVFEGESVDLELPGEKAVQEILPELLRAMNWPETQAGHRLHYAIIAENGQMIDPQDTLSSAGVKQQSVLRAQVSRRPFPSTQAHAARVVDNTPEEIDATDMLSTANTLGSRGSTRSGHGAEIDPDAVSALPSYLSAPSGAQFPLSGAKVSIGRPRIGENRASLLDLSNEEYGHTVSRPHAGLRQRDGLWEAREVLDGTENGTYLNGRKLVPGEWVILQDGDVLRLGWVELRFHEGK